MDYKGRQKRLRNSLGSSHLDGLLVTHLPNIQYLCGFTGSSAALLVTEKQSVFFTDGRYTAQAKEEVQGPRIVISRKGALSTFIDWVKGHKTKLRSLKRMGFESAYMPVSSYRSLAAGLSGVRLRPAQDLVERLRMVKETAEIERLRAAVILGSNLFNTALKTMRPGVKETEVAAEMEYAASKAGAQGMSFSTIIASGQRSALPHGRASAQSIPKDGFVVCDFGVILAGYCSDMTRTVYVGRPTEDARRVYGAVLEAQLAAIETIRPGRKVGEVDDAARKVLQKHKLARYFTHSTGHGVGLEIHEAPRVAAGQQEILRPGMVITVEPGIYQTGKWGVRIEDMVVVTEQGCEVLTPTSKELIAIS